MTIRHMRIFAEVYKTKNITQAAEHLHMTQPAVSRAISEIEQNYGVRLFERMHRGLYETQAAAALYPKAIHILQTYEDLDYTLKNWDSFGTLRVGASVMLGNFLLPQMLLRFQQKKPNICVNAVISNAETLKQKLLNNEIDLAFAEEGLEHADLVSREIGSDRLVLIVPQGHPLLKRQGVTLNDTAEYPLLLREQGSASRGLVERLFAARALAVLPLWESASTQAIVKGVHYGFGISFLPEQIVRQDVENGFVSKVELHEPELYRKHYAVWHKNKFLTEKMQEMLSISKEERT